jgi:hypothetical protein
MGIMKQKKVVNIDEWKATNVGHCVWVSSLSTNRHGGEAI